MDLPHIKRLIESVGQSHRPVIEFIKQAEIRSTRLGVFASSFNPPTIAHLELINRASRELSLGEMLALASPANADKASYECRLEDRLVMLGLALGAELSASIALSSHAYFVDMVEAIERAYAESTDLHFVIGFDTFERVLDIEDRYTARYHGKFAGRLDALGFLLQRSRLVVAERGSAGHGLFRDLIQHVPAGLADRISFLEFPAVVAERSATEVRERVGAGASIAGLVTPAVERYIHEQGLYR
jgi:nicotinate-nucleotide adenylyltransferase